MTHINQRHDFVGAWISDNPVLMAGEVGWEVETRKSKLGDGVTHWVDLPYTVTGISATKADVGLSEVNNTSDMDKPVSTAQQLALNAKADAAATTSALNAKAPLASPVFTGDPKAPTPAPGDNDVSIATTAFVKAAIDAVLLAAHPVGSYYMSDTAADPGTIFGGTWVRVKGKMLVGLDEADTSFDTVGKTGGAKNVTLTAAQIPGHTHGLPGTIWRDNAGTATKFFTPGATGSRWINQSSDGAPAMATDAGTGGGGSHENMPPFTTTYMWRRTA